jgi:acetylglutamate/LysW-gamma-L-alpha-aminoadipate kinase
MLVKVEAALGAIERGVGRVVFADARVERPISRALAGEGTVLRSPAVAVSEVADAEAAR